MKKNRSAVKLGVLVEAALCAGDFAEALEHPRDELARGREAECRRQREVRADAVRFARELVEAHEVLTSGAGVILDFGCWSPDERYAIRAIAERAGALGDAANCEWHLAQAEPPAAR